MSRHIPEQGTGIPHITELARSTYSDTFCSTLCFFFAIEPRKIPPGKTTQDESAYVRFCERSVEQAEFSQANPNSRHRKNAEHDVVPELVRRCVLSTVHERGADTTINETLLKKKLSHRRDGAWTYPPRLPIPTIMARTTPRLVSPPTLFAAHLCQNHHGGGCQLRYLRT